MVMDESNLIVIKEYDSINEAEWDKSLLDGAGIYAMPAQLVVRAEDKKRALEVLEAYTEG